MTPSLNHNKLARCGSPPSCSSSIGRPASSSLGRAATLNHTQHQRLAHTERGKLVGMCAPTLGVAKTGGRCRPGFCRVASTLLFDLPVTGRPFGVGTFPALSQIDGIGAVAAVPVANIIHHRRQRGFQAFAERLPHFRKSFRGRVAAEATKPREASDYAPNTIGEFRNV